MVLKVKTRYLGYELELRRKITVVLGRSGAGKTTLLNAVREQELLGAQLGYRIMLLGGGVTESVAAAALIGWRDFDMCLFDSDELNINKFAGAINKAQIPFIILSRDKISSLPVHYDSVCTLSEGAGSVMRLKRAFSPRLGFSRTLPAVIEDSGIAYRFYRSLFGESATERTIVASAGGFGNIAERVNNLLSGGHKAVQVVADAATFGCCCGNIRDLSRVTCFLPECFEELLAESKMFRRFELPVCVDPLSPEALAYASLERMYEKKVGLCLASNAHVKYEKNGEAPARCLLGSCVGCGKAPSAFHGNGSCRFFSLYKKPSELAGVVTAKLHGEKPTDAVNYIVYAEGKSGELISRGAALEMLSKAKVVKLSALDGCAFEKQVWSESGRLIAVKVHGRWYTLAV